MNEKSRMRNSITNLISGFSYRIVIVLSSFVVRTVFIKCLDDAYLGVNGLYSNILSMLSLAELGFGNAMVYSMYKPLASKDYRKLQQLMELYRKVYAIIGTIILVLGLALVPFLDLLIKNKPDIQHFTFYYILFLLNTVISYWFFAYRNSVLHADQKQYIISNYSTLFNLIKCGFQIVLLLLFHSFTIYLLTQMVCTVAQNICLAIKINKWYPIFDKKEVDEVLPRNETKKIFADVKALMLSKIAHVALNSTDNLIISAFVGLNWVGLLSNYVMLTEAITGILTQITGAIQASLGNYFVKESRDDGYLLFRRIEFLNFWLYGFSLTAFIVLLNPFIQIWIGERFTLPISCVVAIAINFYVAGFMNTLWTFRATLGLFTQGQYRPLVVAALNIILSIVLSQPFGITGVLAATTISRACINLWYDPWIIHSKGFQHSVKDFYLSYIRRIILIGTITTVVYCFSQRIFARGVNLINFTFMVVMTGILPNIILTLVYYHTEEFQYYKGIIYKFVKAKITKMNNR